MKICIIGHGFVGKALHRALKNNVEIEIIDPKYKTDLSLIDIFKPNIVFICAPTPMSNDGTQDITILNSILDDLDKLKQKFITVIKSTVLPDHSKDISTLRPNIVFNPEFLREAHADYDFIHSNLIVFGSHNKKKSQQVADFYKNHTKCKSKEYIFLDPISSSFVKYTINSFLALKVTFFNEINSLFNSSGTNCSWKDFTDILQKDVRMGTSHMDVPGHDGRKGYGGACLPKDTYAFVKYSNEIQKPLSLLKKGISINNNIRKEYTTKLTREIDQNIDFSGEKID